MQMCIEKIHYFWMWLIMNDHQKNMNLSQDQRRTKLMDPHFLCNY